MRRKIHKTPERLAGVRIDAVAAEGKCIVRTDEGVIFVENPTGGPGVAPGDVVDLRITNTKKQYREAVAERVHEWSPYGLSPFANILVPVAAANGSIFSIRNNWASNTSR